MADMGELPSLEFDEMDSGLGEAAEGYPIRVGVVGDFRSFRLVPCLFRDHGSDLSVHDLDLLVPCHSDSLAHSPSRHPLDLHTIQVFSLAHYSIQPLTRIHSVPLRPRTCSPSRIQHTCPLTAGNRSVVDPVVHEQQRVVAYPALAFPSFLPSAPLTRHYASFVVASPRLPSHRHSIPSHLRPPPHREYLTRLIL